MITLPKGQWIAAEMFGLPPFWWGWIVAGLAIGLAIAAWVAPRPGILAERDGSHTSDRTAWRWLLVAIVLGLALHAQGFVGTFNLFDDFRQIHVDKVIKELSSEHLYTILFDNYKGTNQELMYLSFTLNWAAVGRDYWGWYLVNWLLLVPLMLGVAWVGRLLTGDRMVGVLAAAFFAASPITAELLCWMSVRSHLFGLLFTLLTTGAYLEYRREDGPRWGFLVLSVAGFLASQFCKPIYLFVPLWLVAIDLFLWRGRWWLRIVDKLPYVAVGIWSYWRIAAAGAGKRLIRDDPLGGSYLNTILQDFNLLVEYGRSLFVPSELGLLPPFNEAQGLLLVKGTPDVLVNGFAPLASLLILLSVLAIAIAARVRNGDRMPLLWLFLCGLSVATVMNIPNRGHAATFEYRYTVSATVATAIFLGDLAVRLVRGRLGSLKGGRIAVVGALAAYLAWGAVVTWDNGWHWQVSWHFWPRNARLYPHSYYAHYYAGKSHQWNRDNYTAVQHLLVAEDLNAKNDMALHKRLGDNAYYIERYDLAREHWITYFRRYPRKIDDKYLERFQEVGLIVTSRGRVHAIGDLE